MFRKYLNSREILDKKLVFVPVCFFSLIFVERFLLCFVVAVSRWIWVVVTKKNRSNRHQIWKKNISWRPYENWLEIEDNTTNNSHIWWLPFKVKISTRWKMAQMEKEDKCKQGTRWFQLPAEQTIKIFKTSWLREEDLSDEKIPRA